MPALITAIIRIVFALGVSALTALGLYRAFPEQVRVAVPFISQAPQGVWSEPWQNACEEASIVMINTFYKGETDLTPEQAREAILKVFEVKNKTVGPSHDESMETIAAIITAADLNWDAQVVTDPTIEQMKIELAEGRPIIAPVYARQLINPYYAGEGPDYHVVVMTGYDDTTGEFIIHDPGTTRGAEFRWAYQTFYDAINDFLTTKDYTAGPTRVLFTNPQ